MMSETGTPHSAHDIVNQPDEVTIGMTPPEQAIRPGGAIHDPNEKAKTETVEEAVNEGDENSTDDKDSTTDKKSAGSVIIDKNTKFTGELKSVDTSKASLKPGDKLPG